MLERQQQRLVQERTHRCRAAGSAKEAPPMRVFALSDVHVDGPHSENLQFIDSLSDRGYRQSDVLMLAGDVSEDLQLLRRVLGQLCGVFGKVFFCPGNHELWLRGGADDPRNGGAQGSWDKLQLILELCEDLSVYTRPERIGNLWLVPLQSWHHSSFDREPEVGGRFAASMAGIRDYICCRWPDHVQDGELSGSLGIAEWMDSLNNGLWDETRRSACDIISMSHFLPRQELLPEKRYLYFPHLAKAAGSDPLAARLAALRPDIHIFGHTHFAWDSTLDGIRYIQAPLAYPSERHRRLPSLAFNNTAQTRRPPYALPSQRDSSGSNNASVERNQEAAEANAALPQWLPTLIYTASAADADARTAGNGARSAADGNEAAPQQLRNGHMCPPLHAHWSDYYAVHARDPSNTELAPWVVQRSKRRRTSDVTT